MPTPTAPTHDGHDADACARAWFVLRNAHDRVTECLSAALARACGLGISDFEVLLSLRNAGAAPRRIGDLGKTVALSQPALSRLVMRLEQQGLVERAKSDDDQRAVFVTVTDSGREMLRRAIPLHTACVNDHLLSRLTAKEQETLVAILGRITEESRSNRTLP
jgi:DNA-binding MarR family transcriptional regulator